MFFLRKSAIATLFILMVVALPKLCTAQTFTDIAAGITDAKECSLAWGDFDNDGDLDLAIAGNTTGGRITKIYRNTNGTFTDISAGLTPVNQASLAWADYDNDGNLDLVVAGNTGTANSCILYRNDSGTFTDAHANLPAVSNCALAWGDYNGDGSLDLVFASLGTIFRNDKGKFTDINAGMAKLTNGSVGWADYDLDGDLDLAVTGINSSNTKQSIVYRNDDGVFVDASAGLTGVSNSSLAWGDYDGDGDPDLALAGQDSTGYFARVYRNTNGKLSSMGTLPSQVNYSSIAWGDCDNDGDLDIAVAGTANTGRVTKIFKYNAPTGSFADSGASLTAVGYRSCCLAWGDFDNDGDLDLAVAGDTGSSTNSTKIYRNGCTTVNSAPQAPTGLTAVGDTSGVTFGWNASTDTATPSAGLSYNIRIGTSPGHDDVVCSMSSPSTGYRRVPRVGNAQENRSFVKRNLPRGTYYWSVQAIDSAYVGSSWATEQTITVNSCKISGKVIGSGGNGIPGVSIEASSWATVLTDQNGYYEIWVSQGWSGTITPKLAGYAFDPESLIYSNVTGDYSEQNFSTLGGFSSVNVGALVASGEPLAWGDYDNDGDLDLAVSGGTQPGRIYRNDAGTLTDMSANLISTSESALAWGDYDNDGDLDLVISGYSLIDGTWTAVTKLYRNDGGVFADTNALLPGVYLCALAWGDYDNDGDLDLAISGQTGGDPYRITRIYRNDGGVFTDINAGLVGLEKPCLAWGDYDKDGDLDLAVSGSTGDSFVTVIYRNDGGTFYDIQAGLPQVDGAVAWADFDNDGDLDIVVAGTIYGGQPATKIYHNDNGVFSDMNAALPSFAATSLVCGDYDNDGDNDIIATGRILNAYSTRIYRNNGSGNFDKMETNMPGNAAIAGSYLSLGDFDKDGDLDLALSGSVGTDNSIGIYRNDASHPNTPPTSPSGLKATRNGDCVTFSWSAANDTETPSSALSYNLRVGTAPGKDDIFSGMTNPTTGTRLLPAIGNTQENLSWTIKGLQSDNYYWSVQAIDSVFAPSAWAVVGGSQPPTIDIDKAKAKADGQPVSCINAVTAVFGNAFYIEKTDRSSGIRVEKAGHSLKTGDIATVSGIIGHNSDAEQCIFADTVSKTGTEVVDPLGFNNRTLGGGNFAYDAASGTGQVGVTNGTGVNNIGLLVTTWGKVVSVGNDTGGDYFCIDDGSGLYNLSGIKVLGTAPAPVPCPPDWSPINSFVAVTGISSCFRVDSTLERLIRATHVELLK